jgi:hypothetical protein
MQSSHYNSGGIANKTKIRSSLMGRVGDSGISLNTKSPQINKKFRRDYTIGAGVNNIKINESSQYLKDESSLGLNLNSRGALQSSKKSKQPPHLKNFK